MVRKIILVAAVAFGAVNAAQAVADDGSCGNFSTVTTTELKMCVDLAKGPMTPQAQAARKLIENGNASWSKEGSNGTCRMSVVAQGTVGGTSHTVQASCTVTDPSALRACVEKAKYATDVTRCGLEYLKK